MPRGYARWVLAVMVGINLLNYMDRWVGSAVAPLIQAEFHLSDFHVGLLGTAFLLVYALAAVPFGWWADRGVRRTVIGVGVTLWSCATVLSGLVTSYTQLFLTRTVLGIGEASYYPAGTSLLSDYFPKESRGRAMSIWAAGTAIGIALGFAGGGWVGEHFGWRYAFFMTAAPGLFFAFLAFRLREPLRGAVENSGPKVAAVTEATLRKFVALLTIPTLRWTILAQTCLFFVLASNAYWLPTNLHRRFDWSVGGASLVSGLVIVVGGLLGTMLGGWLSDWLASRSAARLRQRHDRAYIEVPLAGMLLAAVLMPIAFLGPLSAGPVPIFIPAFFLTVVCVYLHFGPFSAVSQNVVTPPLRAGAVTMGLLIAHLAGDSHSTADVGWLSDQLRSLTTALMVTSTPLLLLAAGFAGLARRTVVRDTSRMEDTWARRELGAERGTAPAQLPAR